MTDIRLYTRTEKDGKLVWERGLSVWETRCVDVPKGEIVLIGNKRRRHYVKTPDIIAVVEEIWVGKDAPLRVVGEIGGEGDTLVLKRLDYHLHESILYCGQIVFRAAPFVSVYDRRDKNAYVDSESIGEIIVGKESVLKRILADEKLKCHAGWIEKLEKPYNLPRSRAVTFNYIS